MTIVLILIALPLLAEVEEVAATTDMEPVEQTGGTIALEQNRRGNSISILGGHRRNKTLCWDITPICYSGTMRWQTEEQIKKVRKCRDGWRIVTCPH